MVRKQQPKENPVEEMFVALKSRVENVKKTLGAELSGDVNPDMTEADEALELAEDQAGEGDWAEAMGQLLDAMYSLGRASKGEDIDAGLGGDDDDEDDDVDLEMPSDE